jgi:hypothetical protein
LLTALDISAARFVVAFASDSKQLLACWRGNRDLSFRGEILAKKHADIDAEGSKEPPTHYCRRKRLAPKKPAAGAA